MNHHKRLIHIVLSDASWTFSMCCIASVDPRTSAPALAQSSANCWAPSNPKNKSFTMRISPINRSIFARPPGARLRRAPRPSSGFGRSLSFGPAMILACSVCSEFFDRTRSSTGTIASKARFGRTRIQIPATPAGLMAMPDLQLVKKLIEDCRTLAKCFGRAEENVGLVQVACE